MSKIHCYLQSFRDMGIPKASPNQSIPQGLFIFRPKYYPLFKVEYYYPLYGYNII